MSELGWPYEFEYGEEIKDVIKRISRINDEYMAKVAGELHRALDEFAANAERGGLVAQKIRAIHYRTLYTDDNCAGCDNYYPCPTIKALDAAGGGEQE